MRYSLLRLFIPTFFGIFCAQGYDSEAKPKPKPETLSCELEVLRQERFIGDMTSADPGGSDLRTAQKMAFSTYQLSDMPGNYTCIDGCEAPPIGSRKT